MRSFAAAFAGKAGGGSKPGASLRRAVRAAREQGQGRHEYFMLQTPDLFINAGAEGSALPVFVTVRRNAAASKPGRALPAEKEKQPIL